MQILKHSRNLKTGALLLLVILLCFSSAYADDAQPLQLYEDKIKAGLVYDFLKYTNWPADILAKSHNNLRLCLMGNDSLDSYLSLLKGRTVQQYTIMITPAKSIAETENCSMVFIHGSQENILPQIFLRLNGKRILTVSDIDQFISRGGMIEIRKQNDHIEFSINERALDQAGLSIQSRLLKLAKPASG
jgi:hypothetical protein